MNTESSLPWNGAQVRTANPNSAVAFFAKRLLDISGGALLSLALLPLLPVIAALIKLDSPGPVFFKHKRVGARRRMRSGQPVWEVTHFPMFKFRSMVENADQSLHEAHVLAFVEGRLTSADSAKLEGDRRVTRVGKVLRRTSLDELPQLFNVLRGEMSLVGPRPVPTLRGRGVHGMAARASGRDSRDHRTLAGEGSGAGVFYRDGATGHRVRPNALFLAGREAPAPDHSGSGLGPGRDLNHDLNEEGL